VTIGVKDSLFIYTNMFFIKNQTPYKGKLKLKFEKYPHYSNRKNKLNKVHLNLGFTKLVSRIKINDIKTDDGFELEIDPVKLELIQMYTDGKIGEHKFGPNNEHTLHNSFLSQDGTYIGGIGEAWWYFKNGMTVCDEYPRGVAIVWRTSRWDKTVVSGIDGVKGYYGYSHRGGHLFQIGDRLFEENYVPKKEDYPEEEWNEYVKKFTKTYQKGDEFDQEWLFSDGIVSIIPFKRRGKKVVENLSDALQAAINMSKYLS